ncbi:MAG: glutathione S-transferase [Hyphomicrobium sp.]
MSEAAKPRLTLYHATPSRSSTALWMLEEVGEPFAIELLNLKTGEQHKPEYLAINPMGKVPTLVDGKTVVSESSAICCYLADAYPAAGLAPAIDDPARAVPQVAVLRAELRRAGDHRQGAQPAGGPALDGGLGRLRHRRLGAARGDGEGFAVPAGREIHGGRRGDRLRLALGHAVQTVARAS